MKLIKIVQLHLGKLKAPGVATIRTLVYKLTDTSLI